MKARENAVSEPAGQAPLEAICWTHTLDFSTGFFYEGHKYDSRDVKVREASVIKASSEMSPDVKSGLRSGGRKKKKNHGFFIKKTQAQQGRGNNYS